jgi:hypothetical protein
MKATVVMGMHGDGGDSVYGGCGGGNDGDAMVVVE